ncbi:hypothetical protein DB88DRAFT_308209 [Papiliotrema laurentii]|uniref:Uncharacterized protein n=1 Tax=Papiliotrema laurentii TaxID=5418 RepID=A0AAD9D0C6_PAPLA|nr:hypothetical protein DB88DRAFT_308209 [Papiliotrema laurentii]
MAVPYAIWAGMGMPTMNPSAHHNIAYGIPAIPPSANPLVVDPMGAIRDYTEHATNADPKQLCDVWALKCLEDWAKDDAYRKVIIEVISSRLDLPWPHNYKALDILGVMPLGSTLELYDKVKALAEAPSSVVGAAELKKLAKPLADKADEERKKKEEQEMNKRQAAIAAMWGGLWADNATNAPAGLAAAGFYGWQYPYQVVPGVPAQAPVQWTSKAPEGWTPSSITPVPQVYPFSRAGYYALVPVDSAPPDPPKPTSYRVSVTASPGPALHGVSKTVPLGLDQLAQLWEKQRQDRGWG